VSPDLFYEGMEEGDGCVSGANVSVAVVSRQHETA
jgi:hypothetical protein